MITRAIRAGGQLANVEDAIERLRPVGEFLEGHDPFFTYPHHQYRGGKGPPPSPGSMIGLERRHGQQTTRVDAVPRDPEAADRFRPTLKVAFEGEDGTAERRRLDDALLRIQPVTISRGVSATFTRMPPAFGDAVARPFAAEISIHPIRDPWWAEFRILSNAGEQSVRVRMEPVDDAPADWDVAFEGRVGGLCISLLARFAEGREQLAVNWPHRLDGSPAREQLRALRLLVAVHEEGVLVIRECDEGVQLLRARNEPLAVDERFPGWISLLANLVDIEDWIGTDISVSGDVSGSEIEAISLVAEAIRAGRLPFNGKRFELIGDAAAVPELLAAKVGAKVEIGEDWMVELLGRDVCIGRRTVAFPLAAVCDEGEVEPGRNAVALELDPSQDLFWVLEPPNRSAVEGAAA